jgi:hypothetical protein
MAGKHNNNIKLRRDLIAFSDGQNDLFDITIKLKSRLNLIIEEYKLLQKNKILKKKYI